MISCKRNVISCGLATLLAVASFTSHLPAQTAIEQLRETFGRGMEDRWFQGTMKHLEDHRKFKAMLIKSLDMQIEQLSNKQVQLDDKQMVWEMEAGSSTALASGRIQEDLVGRCLQQLMDTRLEIAANKSYLEQVSKNTKSSATEAEALGVRVAQTRVELHAKKLRQLEELFETGAVSNLEVIEAQVELGEAEAELAERLAVVEMKTVGNGKSLDEQVNEIQLSTLRLKALEQAAAEQLKQLSESRRVVRQLDSVQASIDNLNDQMRVLRMRRFELQLELDELDNLRRMCELTQGEQPAREAVE